MDRWSGGLCHLSLARVKNPLYTGAWIRFPWLNKQFVLPCSRECANLLCVPVPGMRLWSRFSPKRNSQAK